MARTLATIAVLVAGLCTTTMNWRFSYQLGTSPWDSCTLAVFSVALDVSKWLMLPFAARAWRDHKSRSVAAGMIWLVATIYSFTAAIGFAAVNRETMASDRRSQAELMQKLELMRHSPRWQSTAACADVTTAGSKDFCGRYAAAASQLKHEITEADPQSVLLARITGSGPETVRLILSIFLGIACEVISSLGFFALLAPTANPVAKAARPTRPAWKTPTWSGAWSHKRANVGPWRAAARHGAP